MYTAIVLGYLKTV